MPMPPVFTFLGIERVAMSSWKTAISRKKPSAPMRRLDRDNRLVGRVLDYGCGKGYDADYYNTDSYDPHYQPVMPKGKFDTIVCNFVLNVIESAEEREAVLSDIRARLGDNGHAYVSVRTDKSQLNGHTKIGTWQGSIVLDLPVVAKGSGFVTYKLQ